MTKNPRTFASVAGILAVGILVITPASKRFFVLFLLGAIGLTIVFHWRVWGLRRRQKDIEIYGNEIQGKTQSLLDQSAHFPIKNGKIPIQKSAWVLIVFQVVVSFWLVPAYLTQSYILFFAAVLETVWITEFAALMVRDGLICRQSLFFRQLRTQVAIADLRGYKITWYRARRAGKLPFTLKLFDSAGKCRLRIYLYISAATDVVGWASLNLIEQPDTDPEDLARRLNQ